MHPQRATSKLAPVIKLFHYEGCGTCKKARAWLTANKVAFSLVPIVESPPSKKELKALIEKSGKDAKKWINTSGGSYRAAIESEGKEAVLAWSEDELLTRLAADGKMIKRPIAVTETQVLVGFDEAAYAAAFLAKPSA